MNPLASSRKRKENTRVLRLHTYGWQMDERAVPSDGLAAFP